MRRVGAFIAIIQPLIAEAQTPAPGNWSATVTPPRTPDTASDFTANSSTGSPGPHRSLVFSSAVLEGDHNRTRLAFTASHTFDFTISRLSNPYRVIIDLDQVDFRLPANAGRQGQGIVSAYRYGLFAQGKARVVIDTTGPARIETARLAPAVDGRGYQFEIELSPTTSTELAAAELATAAQGIELPASAADTTQAKRIPADAGTHGRPVVVIDPGHGGVDPGAQGSRGYEKDVVLAVALEVRRGLISTRRFDVVMTRSSDVFVSLDQRVRISQKSNADLFVSIHADSLSQKELAQNIRGATIYALSERASDERSRALAEKENAADLLAGVNFAAESSDGKVRDILFDLMRRETHSFSNEFRSILAGQLRPKLRLAKDPIKSGPFRVLRQPGSPSVLIELGYMTNAEDENLMASREWQQGVADGIAKAIGAFFQKHPPGTK